MKRKQTETTADTLFNKNNLPSDIKGIPRPSRKLHNGKYTIYSINTLSDLISIAFDRKKMSSKQIGKVVEKKIKLRFLLTTNFELLFAEEGDANNIIPPHFIMTGAKSIQEAKCYAAGNVTFNLVLDEKSQIVDYKIMKATNKSGDFKPPFDSLQLALGVMFANYLKFSDELIIEQHNVHSVCHKYSLITSELKEFIDRSSTQPQKNDFVQNNKELSTRKYEYLNEAAESNSRSDFFRRSGIKPRIARPLFTDDIDVKVDPSIEDAAIAAVTPKAQALATKPAVLDLLEEDTAKVLR